MKQSFRMKILTVDDICGLVQAIGIEVFLARLIGVLEEDFARWEQFQKSARHVTRYEQGVIELMPCADDELYAFKYVNGHPGNPARHRLSVVALGLLSEVATGYPLLFSEMTLLTAFRTAATGALAARYLARPEAATLAVIGTGAQSEFQVLALAGLFPLRDVRYFDLDREAMDKFAGNLATGPWRTVACASVGEAILGADIIVTATAARKRQSLFAAAQVAPGTHIQAIGGDSPGKTELDPALLDGAKIVVEYLPQTLVEGEVQQRAEPRVHAELWELVTGRKPGREGPGEITMFDSVGFALEDYSVLRLVHELASERGVGVELPLIPELADPKNLFGLLK